MNPNTATEYRDLPLNVLIESTTNPRRIFEDAALNALADSIRFQSCSDFEVARTVEVRE
jgi:ParB family chromosome partitioning protein